MRIALEKGAPRPGGVRGALASRGPEGSRAGASWKRRHREREADVVLTVSARQPWGLYPTVQMKTYPFPPDTLPSGQRFAS
jgi:hypothetical protein